MTVPGGIFTEVNRSLPANSEMFIRELRSVPRALFPLKLSEVEDHLVTGSGPGAGCFVSSFLTTGSSAGSSETGESQLGGSGSPASTTRMLTMSHRWFRALSFE